MIARRLIHFALHGIERNDLSAPPLGLTDAQRQRLVTNSNYYRDSWAKLVRCVNLEHAGTTLQFGFPVTVLDLGPYTRTVWTFRGRAGGA
jgi:hypothetical protein